MKAKVIAYDLDGVLVPSQKQWWLEIVWRIYPRLASHIMVWLNRNSAPLMLPPKDALIITGRGNQLRSATLKWFARNGLPNRLLMIDVAHTNRRLAIYWKWEQLIKHKVNIFYENDKETIKQLRNIDGLKIVAINYGTQNI